MNCTKNYTLPSAFCILGLFGILHSNQASASLSGIPSFVQVTDQGALVLHQNIYHPPAQTFTPYPKDSFGNVTAGNDVKITEDGRYVFFTDDEANSTNPIIQLFGDWIRPTIGIYPTSIFRKDMLTGKLDAVNTTANGTFINARILNISADGNKALVIAQRWLTYQENVAQDLSFCAGNALNDDQVDCPYVITFDGVNGKKTITPAQLPVARYYSSASDDLQWNIVAFDQANFNVLLNNTVTGKTFTLYADWRYMGCGGITGGAPKIFIQNNIATLYFIPDSEGQTGVAMNTVDLTTGALTSQCVSVDRSEIVGRDDYGYSSDGITVENGVLQTILWSAQTTDKGRQTFLYDAKTGKSKLQLTINDYATGADHALAFMRSPDLRYGLIQVTGPDMSSGQNSILKKVILRDYWNQQEIELPLDSLSQ